MLDFESQCLGLWAHCKACEMLPTACADYQYGDWYYFTMPDAALVEFRSAVNTLHLGSSKKAIMKTLGKGHYEAKNDKSSGEVGKLLPFWFPELAVSDDSAKVTYYTMKFRQSYKESANDRGVTFFFDQNHRLSRIESKVEGVASRP